MTASDSPLAVADGRAIRFRCRGSRVTDAAKAVDQRPVSL